MITIDLENTYTPHYVNSELNYFKFNGKLKNGETIELHVHIMQHGNIFLPNVYNFAFGPLNEDGEINDSIKLKHENISKLFSTLIFYGLTFLNEKDENTYIGIDGSDDLRAMLYHKMFKANFKNLNEILSIVGVDWYVRLLRNQREIELDENNNPFFKPRPEPFDLQRESKDLYRYYMYKLN